MAIHEVCCYKHLFDKECFKIYTNDVEVTLQNLSKRFPIISIHLWKVV